MVRLLLAGIGLMGLIVPGTAAFAQGKPTGEQLKRAAIEEMFSKPRMAMGYSNTLASLFAIGTQPNGTAVVQIVHGNWSNWQGEGTWRLLGDTFCTTFSTAPVTTEDCVHIYRQSDGSFQSWGASDGKLHSTAVAKRME